MEKRDLYDKNRQKTNEIIDAKEAVPENRYILVVLTLIQNAEGKILVQKRSEQKGGKYGLTAGHAKMGETSRQGMITEIREELGINIKPESLKLMYSERNDIDRCFYDLYYLQQDIDTYTLVLEPKEVELVKWCSKEEIKALCQNNEFKKSHIEAFEILADKIS